MIIIIEGADLVGKTVISGLLSKRLNVPVSRIWMDLTNPKPSAKSVAHTLHLLCNAISPNIIFDRFFISEYVYGAVLEREYEYIRDLIAMWADIPNMFLVLLVASEKSIRERYAIRNDWYLDLDQILSVNTLYPSIKDILPSNISFLEINTSLYSPDDCVRIIIKWLSEYETISFTSSLTSE